MPDQPPHVTEKVALALSAYEPEATAAVLRNPEHLLSVLLEAGRRAVLAAAPEIRAQAQAGLLADPFTTERIAAAIQEGMDQAVAAERQRIGQAVAAERQRIGQAITAIRDDAARAARDAAYGPHRAEAVSRALDAVLEIVRGEP